MLYALVRGGKYSKLAYHRYTRDWNAIKCVCLIRGPITCAARVRACDRVSRGTNSITSPGDTEQTPNKRELSRVIVGDHALSTTIARVITFGPRLNCV